MMKKPVLLAAALCLSACITVPYGTHQFSVAADDPQHASWMLGSVSLEGQITLEGMLEEARADKAARLRLWFGNRDSWKSGYLTIEDKGCDGIYEVALEYSTGDHTTQLQHFKRGARWGQPLRLHIVWSDDGRVRVTLNGDETVTAVMQKPVTQFEVQAMQGGLHISQLAYTAPAPGALP